MLESSSTLRASGFAFTTWTNAFRALDALGVGDKIREHHLLYERSVTLWPAVLNYMPIIGARSTAHILAHFSFGPFFFLIG